MPRMLSEEGGLDITGQADQVDINISGTGSVNAPDLKVKTASISISGLGNATLWVTDLLRAISAVEAVFLTPANRKPTRSRQALEI